MDNKADFMSLAGLRPDGRRSREIRRVRCRFGVFKVTLIRSTVNHSPSVDSYNSKKEAVYTKCTTTAVVFVGSIWFPQC